MTAAGSETPLTRQASGSALTVKPARSSTARPAGGSASRTRTSPVVPAASRPATEPDRITRPWDMMATRSQTCCTSLSWCEDSSTVTPLAPSRTMSSRTSLMPAASRPLPGSSRISSSGFFSSAAAMPSRCFMPSE